jgi:hypothetical protein
MKVDIGPLRPLSEVGIVLFGDGIFAGESLLDILNIQSTRKICLDVFNLTPDTDSAWPKEFGKAWPRLKDEFNDLVYSETKAIYKVRHEALKARLTKKNVPTWNEYLENNFHGHKRQFARCYVTFNLGKTGSSSAEANHSSCVRLLLLRC